MSSSVESLTWITYCSLGCLLQRSAAAGHLPVSKPKFHACAPSKKPRYAVLPKTHVRGAFTPSMSLSCSHYCPSAREKQPKIKFSTHAGGFSPRRSNFEPCVRTSGSATTALLSALRFAWPHSRRGRAVPIQPGANTIDLFCQCSFCHFQLAVTAPLRKFDTPRGTSRLPHDVPPRDASPHAFSL